jgi:hypothetical protein
MTGEPLPLDDPRRWLPLIEAHRQIGLFASFDLVKELRDGRLHCMRRSLTDPGERELVPASFWSDIEIEVNHDIGRIQLYRGPARAVETHSVFEDIAPVHRGYFRDPQTRVDDGWAFFV